MTEVMVPVGIPVYDEPMRDFEPWLRDMTTKPLPGGVSAAALAAAMAAALLAKATRLSLQKQDVSEEDRAVLQAVLDLACQQQPAFVNLVQADERAYRALLASRAQGRGTLAEGDLWREATEVPLSLAEACHLLLGRLPGILELCWPPVEPDLQVGQWLLEVGRRAGLAAAENNLRAWPAGRELGPLQARLAALQQAHQPESCCGTVP